MIWVLAALVLIGLAFWVIRIVRREVGELRELQDMTEQLPPELRDENR
jgi:hypothetical protein